MRPFPRPVQAIGLIAALLCGCDHAVVPDPVHPAFTDPVKRHPISVVADRAELDIAVHEGRRGRALVKLEATRFARHYAREARGPLVIAIPARLDGRHASFAHVRDIQEAVVREGIPTERVRVLRKPGNFSHDTITLSYDRIAAVGPICDDWSKDVTVNPDHLPYANFGCATQRNLAHMVTNPTDLSFPAREDARGSDRRAATRKVFVDAVTAPAKVENTK